MQVTDYKVIAPLDQEVKDDATRTSQMRQPLSLCILRPKLESAAALPNGETIGAFLNHKKSDQLDSNVQRISDRSLKAEEDAPVFSSDEPCAVQALPVSSVSGQDKREHTCSYCDKSFSQAGNLKMHIRSVHLNQRPYSCEYCKQLFTEKNHVRRHIETVHLKKSADGT
ncbi:unnamed protein product [Dicrocoelium dendriticum]|nr:unnamed protein product [Dicrocoelium dendriticum]